MKFLAVVTALVGVAAASSQVLPAGKTPISPKCPLGGGNRKNFAKTSGRLFEIDGKVQYFAGTNSWWLSHLSKDSDIDAALKEMKRTGYKVTRVWGFGDVNVAYPATNTDPNRVWFQLHNSTGSYINYGSDGLERLDYVVSAAEKWGVKLVLNFVNYWDDYGGIQAYINAYGGNKMTWYTDKASQDAYRNYIKVLVGRYKTSEAIFAWELGNEPRCIGCGLDVLEKWIEDTAAYIKSLDPYHMVTTGSEGFFGADDGVNDGKGVYSGSDGVSFKREIQATNIDYATFHLYPSWWSMPYEWGNTWIKEHDAIGKQFGKPVVLEEYGTPFPHNHTETILPWLNTILESNVAADQIWQFGPSKTSVSAETFGDQFMILMADDESKVLCNQHAAKMSAKKVRKVPRRWLW